MENEGRVLAERYKLDREIGRGGMGSVWLAHDIVLDRDVAVKQIGMTRGDSAPDLERAEREAHLAARVNHQNVVAVFDLVDEDDLQWLVMELVDGPSLAGLISERGALGPAEVAAVVEQVAGALAAAHEHGIVHRDVKPSNILLTHDGTAKLSDFGVARAQADASLTQTGLVTGSPAYLSPEVASGRTATAASDVWSLGASIFHALAGHPPYAVGDNVLGAMYQIVNEEPPTLDGDGPLPTLVASMMQHDPAARPSMSDVAVAATTGAAPATLDLDATQGFAAFEAPAEPTPTTAFRPLAPPAAAAAEAPRSAPHRIDSKPDRRLWVAAAAAAVIVAIVLIGTRGGDDPSTDTPRAAASSSTPSGSPSPSAGDADPDGQTALALEGFVTDYLTTASNDPDAGFAMLTPSFQDESNGIKGYKSFWKGVKSLDIEKVSADPAALKVSYTYSYDFKGDRRSDAVTLQLERSGDGFLIAGEV